MSIIFLIFFLSGAAALTYEIVWMRELSLIFGVTVFATSAVLATFMGGLSLGSFLSGKRSDHFRRPLFVYAVLEFGIGAYALLIPSVFDLLRYPYIALYQTDLPYPVLAFGRAILAAIVLLPPTLLMGATLPVLASFLIRHRGNVGRQLSLLYFVNTAGAVAGCTLSGFYLIEHFGLTSSTRLAAALNFLLALLSAAADRFQRSTWHPEAATARSTEGHSATVSPALARLALYAIGISGFTALAYEVLWTRALLRYLYNSTYAFTTMLMVFLSGLAIGSWLCLILPYRRRKPVLVFAALELGVALGFLSSVRLFPGLADASLFSIGSTVNSFGESMLLMLFRSTMILFLPAVFLGATIPLATEICARRLREVGRTVGSVYAVNTLGAILGSIAVAFVLIPGLGMQGTLRLLIAANLMLGAVLIFAALTTARLRLTAGGIMIVLLAGILVSMREDVFRSTFAGPRRGNLIFYKEGATDTVGVIDYPGGGRVIRYEDRRGTAGTVSYNYQYYFGHLPVLLHPGRPKNALHICFGVGNSLWAIAAHEFIEHIDSVELSPHVLEAAPYFWTNNGVVDNPKTTTIIDDGRNFVMASDRVYDVIALEPPLVYTAGVINLYTREFYEETERRLADDGMLVQWIPVGEAPLRDERMLFRAFFDVFPHGTAWQQLTRDGNIMLLGSKQPLRIDYQLLKEKFNDPRVRLDMELSNVPNVEYILSTFVFDSAALAEFVKDVPPVTDDNTVLDFSMPRYLGSMFGLYFSAYAPAVSAGGKTFLDVYRERTRFYYRARRSVLPYLFNLGGEDPKELENRIRSIKGLSGGYIPGNEAKWKRQWKELLN